MTKHCHVVISILNWNSAGTTLQAVRSVLALSVPEGVTTEVVVLDNGSAADDLTKLQAGLAHTPVRLLRNQHNGGFAGGHNTVLHDVLVREPDFVWLLNSDAITPDDCLAKLLRLMADQPGCGVASPLIVRSGRPDIVDFAGAVHDWGRLESHVPCDLVQAQALANAHPRDLWVVGTAMLLRVSALQEVGLLDEHYFAYYEDDDLCVRMGAGGWHSAVAYDAHVEHACFEGSAFERPVHYFYLMARNAFRFWTTHTPLAHRHALRLRLLDTWLLYSNRLDARGDTDKRDACLLGIWDGLMRRGGAFRIASRRVPWPLQLLRIVRLPNHRAHMAPQDGVNIRIG